MSTALRSKTNPGCNTSTVIAFVAAAVGVYVAFFEGACLVAAGAADAPQPPRVLVLCDVDAQGDRATAPLDGRFSLSLAQPPPWSLLFLCVLGCI